MTDVIDEAVRREQALQLERIRLTVRKAARASEIDPAVALAWKRLGVPHEAVTQIRKILSNLALRALGEIKGQVLRSDLLAALGTLKDSLSAAPTAALPSATRTLLLASIGPETAATVCDLYDAGLEVVPADMLPPIRCLTAEEPQLSDVEVLQTRWGVEWRLFADMALISLGHAPLNPEQLTTMLWKPTSLVDPAQSGLYRWVAFLHAYELTLHRNLNTAWAQLKLFKTPYRMMTPIEKEVVNLRAYLMLLKAGDDKIGDAIALLDTIRRSPMAKKNWDLLRARRTKTRNERSPIENPYLALGVDHGASRDRWRSAWMAIRSAKRNDLDAMSAVNEARDQILELEKDESNDLGRVYIIPLDRRFVVALPNKGESNNPQSTEHSTSVKVMRLAALHELLKLLPRSLSNGTCMSDQNKPYRHHSKDRSKNKWKERSQPRNPAFGRAEVNRPAWSVDELAGQFTKKINTDAIMTQISAKLDRSEIADTLYRAFLEQITTTNIYRTWLAEIDRIVRNAEDITAIRYALSAYLRQAGISRIEDIVANEERFVISGGSGDRIVTTQPAYIDKLSNKTILSGRARRIEQQDS